MEVRVARCLEAISGGSWGFGVVKVVRVVLRTQMDVMDGLDFLDNGPSLRCAFDATHISFRPRQKYHSHKSCAY